MSVPHEPTTPIAKSQSSRSLVPSPARNRRDLTYGSPTKSASLGYGIVSAAGLDAWRRGPRTKTISQRASTSTATSTTAAGKSTVGDGLKRKGLGMGLESTPGRKKFKRFSKASKPSIGTQSTPKTARSRSTLANAVQAGSADRTCLSELSSNMPSSVSSASARVRGRNTSDSDPFAIEADTIVGKDVFGLTVAIDQDGTLQGISPARPRQTTVDTSGDWRRSHEGGGTQPWQWTDNSFDDEDETWTDERAMEDLLDWTSVEVDRMSDVPDEVLEMNNWIHEPEAYQQMVHPIADHTVYWDSTTPIHETSEIPIQPAATVDSGDFGQEFTYDDQFVTMLDDVSILELSVPLNDVSVPSPVNEMIVDQSMIRRRTSREKIASRPKTPRRPTPASKSRAEEESGMGEEETSVELSRGLNMSKPDVRNITTQIAPAPGARNEEELLDSAPLIPSPLPLLPDPLEPTHLSLSPVGLNDGDVEVTERIRQPSLDRGQPNTNLVDSGPSSDGTSTAPDDPFGFRQAQKAIKRAGVRPRRYRATSELETPPRVSARVPSEPVDSAPASPEGVMEASPDKGVRRSRKRSAGDELQTWRGVWRGGRQSKIRAIRTEDKLDTSDDSLVVHGKKIFYDPKYDGAAERARDARLAHYDDLKTNYALHVKSGFFF